MSIVRYIRKPGTAIFAAVRILAGARVWAGARVLAAAALAFGVTACTTSDPPESTRALSLSGDKTVAFDATTTTLTIKATTSWKLAVSLGADWITPDYYAGVAGETRTINFTLGVNDTGRKRTGRVTVTATGETGDPYIFTIIQQQQNVLMGVNEWIRQELEGWYYWNAAVKNSLPPSNDLAYDDFMERSILGLRWADVQDTSNGENPPTIDGRWNSSHTGRRSIYSYIERTGATTRAAQGTGTTFGFEIEAFEMRGTGGQYELVVTLVRPGGPADKAGLKRGDRIVRFDGAAIYEMEYERFWNRLHNLTGGTTMAFTDSGGKPYALEAVEMKIDPVIHHEVITTGGGRKVAYLMYNEFEPGENGEFDNELRKVFREFKSAGATSLVLDLRYNRGGYVSSSQVLSSLAGDVSPAKVFVKMMRNATIKSVDRLASNPELMYFLNEANSLKLNNIYVLATGYTASASEMVINALRGVDVTVVHIGERTEGKNVGMDLRSTKIGAYEYRMWPITFKGLNAKDFTDYADGFVPDVTIDEFHDVVSGGTLYPLGDRQERLLRAALTLIDGGTVTPDTRATRATDTPRIPVPAPEHPVRGGAKYIPE